jgi:chemotaxis protein MotB
VTKQTWIIASILSLVAVLGLVGITALEKSRSLNLTRNQLEALRQSLESLEGKKQELEQTLEEKAQLISQLEEEKNNKVAAHRSLEEEMRDALQQKEVTISQLKGRLTVNIVDRILFESGEATVRPEGEELLSQIAVVLSQHTNRQIHVIGHTDNVPIRAGSKGRYPSNWELSTARATAAVRFLSEKAGLDPKRLAAVGYGEFHPIADNSSAEGRSKNRRIAIVVLPEEFKVAEGSYQPKGAVVKEPSTQSVERGEQGQLPARPAPEKLEKL